MASTKPVALVIGASRGMGRQMAIGLAGEGYTGEMIEGALFTIGGQVTDNEERSHHRSENNIRSRETGILSTRSTLTNPSRDLWHRVFVLPRTKEQT